MLTPLLLWDEMGFGVALAAAPCHPLTVIVLAAVARGRKKNPKHILDDDRVEFGYAQPKISDTDDE
jgi:hypothetical protein